MSNQENTSFDELVKLHSKHFSLEYLGSNLSDKLACIALTCYITNTLRKQDKTITCYDVLLKIGKQSGFDHTSSFLKSLGAICEDFMYSCDVFPNFGIPTKEMPARLKFLLDKYLPF